MSKQGSVQKFQKIGQTIFLESGGLAGRQFAGFDEGGGVAGDDGSRVVEEVGFGFGGGGGEVGGVAKEGEEIGGRILQAGQYFSSLILGNEVRPVFPKWRCGDMARWCSEIPKNRSDHFFGKLVVANTETRVPKCAMMKNHL